MLTQTQTPLLPGATTVHDARSLLAEPEADFGRAPIRVFLVDDHPVVLKGLGVCLARQAALQVVGEAGTGQLALSRILRLQPDIVLMDIELPDLDGMAVAETLHQKAPGIKVVFLSMHENSNLAGRVLQSGARGYLLKETSISELVRAIEAVAQGETFFSPSMAQAALQQVSRSGRDQLLGPLTPREGQVLVKIAEGLSNKEIAGRLGVGVRTVETHRERIMRKLDIHSIAGLTRYAVGKGLITLPGERVA